MPRYKPPCSVCAKPGARQVVDKMLEQKVSLKEIAARVGIHKSSIHRHSARCVVRVAAEKVRASRFDPLMQLVWVRWPDGSTTLQGVPLNFRGTVGIMPGPNDVVLKVQFEERRHRELPNPNTEATHDEALAEDAARIKP